MRFSKSGLRGLYMRTAHFENSAGHRIEIIGVTHVASQIFWDSITETLAAKEAAGYVVHLEGLQPPVRDDVTADEQKRLDHLGDILSLSGRVAETVGLVHQKTSKHVTPSMKAIDMDRLTLVNTMDAEKLEMVGNIVSKDTTSARPRLMLWVLRNIGWLSAVLDRFPAADILDRGVIIGERNKFAINAALAEKQNVVLLWGAAHLPGMAELLTEAGYKPSPKFDGIDVQWRLAITRSHKVPRKSATSTAASTARVSLAAASNDVE